MAKEIYLGAGCFWCTEAVFEMFKGIVSTAPGYAGGKAANPTYEEVCSGTTGHAEVLRVEYDPKVIPLEKILEIFFAMHDPTTINRQGADVGEQYRSIILYTTEAQKKEVLDYVKKIRDDYGKPIVTEIKKLGKFYEAEGYHKKYFDKNPHQPYCMFVISPKIAKMKKEFGL